MKRIPLDLFRCLSPIIMLLVIAPRHAIAQTPQGTPQFGIVPFGSYTSYHVDTVNMQNGNDIIKIPLFSLPQLGKLSFGFSLVSNTTYWVPTESCTPDGLTCDFQYDSFGATYIPPTNAPPGDIQIGPAIVPDAMPTVSWTAYNSDYGAQGTDSSECAFQGSQISWCYSAYWTVYDSTGGSHSLYYDANNLSQMRTTDGSGFLYLSGLPHPEKSGLGMQGTPTSAPVLIDAQGIKNTFTSNGTLVSQTDLDNNSITVGIDYTDSVGRHIPFVPQATSSTAGCPDLHLQGANQPATSSANWQVPGPSGTVTYLICYADIYYHTSFFSNNTWITYTDGDGNNHSISYHESVGHYAAIQSVVLPNKTYWAFLYDAANSSDSTSIGYGTLSKLITPEGGSISYTYGQAAIGPCNPAGFSAMFLSTRTVSDANGNSYLWNYSFGPPGGSNTSVTTDPNENDTVYTYQPPSWYGNNVCAPLLETNHKQYEGSKDSGTRLLTVATSYTTVGEPIPAGDQSFSGYGNANPHVVTTTNDASQVSTSTTESYAGSFAATMPYCGLFWNFTTQVWECNDQSVGSVALTLSLPASNTIADYSGSVLASSTTAYRWQDPTDGATYLGENLLDTPTVVTTYADSAHSVQVAQITTAYDEHGYIASDTIKAGHPTSVTRWNNGTSTNGGLPVTTYTAWTSHGMIDHTVDGRSHTSNQYNYNYSANSSQYINLFPSSVTNALLQDTSYTWDVNTGQVLSITDPNLQTTNFVYDDAGRLIDVKSPATAHGQKEAKACYTDEGGSFCTKADPPFVMWTQQNSDAGSIVSSQVFDGLGRGTRKSLASDPGGPDLTDSTYDGLDQVVTVTNPYRASPQSGDPAQGKTFFEYDALGRTRFKHAQTMAGGNLGIQEWSYSGSSTTFKDETLRTWIRTSNAAGQLTQVMEPDPNTGTPSVETDYCYDTLGNLTGVAHGDCSTSTLMRKFSYDSLSHLTKACNPETLHPGVLCSDVSAPGIVYTYDGNGNVTTKTDTRGVTTTYSYDELNRLTSKTYSGSDSSVAATPSSCYLYDTSSNGTPVPYPKGRLTAEWTTHASCTTTPLASNFETRKLILEYDALGQLRKEEQCGPGHCNTTVPDAYSLKFDYDLAGPISSFNNGLKGADAITFFNTYNTAGRLITLSAFTQWSDLQHPSTLFSAEDLPSYSPAGNLQQWHQGAGLSSVRTFDARDRVIKQVTNGYH